MPHFLGRGTMEKEFVKMSRREMDRALVVRQVVQRQNQQREATSRQGVNIHQIKPLVQRRQPEGPWAWYPVARRRLP